MAFIAKLISFLSGLLDVFKWFRKREAEKEKAAAVERAQAHEKAIEDLKNAETDEEMFDAQSRIVNTRPR